MIDTFVNEDLAAKILRLKKAGVHRGVFPGAEFIVLDFMVGGRQIITMCKDAIVLDYWRLDADSSTFTMVTPNVVMRLSDLRGKGVVDLERRSVLHSFYLSSVVTRVEVTRDDVTCYGSEDDEPVVTFFEPIQNEWNISVGDCWFLDPREEGDIVINGWVIKAEDGTVAFPLDRHAFDALRESIGSRRLPLKDAPERVRKWLNHYHSDVKAVYLGEDGLYSAFADGTVLVKIVSV